MQQQLKLNLGCGHNPPQGWINVDYALGARFAKFPYFNRFNNAIKFFKLTWDRNILLHNLKTPFPWKDSSVDIIYSSHTLEHFTKEEGVFFLNECSRVLKTGGIIRVIVPDLQILVTRYLQGAVRADDFLTTLVVNYYSDQDSPFRKKIAPFLRSPHKCMYDSETLLRKIQDAGFHAACREPFKSTIPDIDAIENSERTYDVVIVEGTKR